MVCTMSHTIYSSGMCVGGFRIELQTMGRRRPLSRWMLGVDFLI